MLWIKRHPSNIHEKVRSGCAAIQCCHLRNRGEKERHAVVVDGRAPLSHGGMGGVEDVVGIVGKLDGD